MDAALAIALTALVVASATLFIAWQQLRTARESRGRSLDVGCWPRGQHFADGEVTRRFGYSVSVSGPGQFADVTGHIADNTGKVRERLWEKLPRLDNTDEPLSGEVRYTDDEARDLYFLATWILPEGNSVRSGAIRIRLLPEKCGCWCSRLRGRTAGGEYFRWHRWTGRFRNWTYQCWLRWGPDRTPENGLALRWFAQGKWKPQRRDTANEVTMQGFPRR